ncbi:MAG: hypothetical protein GF355_06750, partial [Candidatus Eisenbacteria bacterium]|nr:hypothetical protein [Candidatus Eisenbacteria bacterium]
MCQSRYFKAAALVVLSVLCLAPSALGPGLRDTAPEWAPNWWGEEPFNTYSRGLFGFAFTGDAHPYTGQMFFSDTDGIVVTQSAVPDVGHVWDWDYRFDLEGTYDGNFTAYLYCEWTATTEPGGLVLHTLEGPYYSEWTAQNYEFEEFEDGRTRTAHTYSIAPSPMDICPKIHARGDGSMADTVWVGLIILDHEAVDLIHNDPPPPGPRGPGRAGAASSAQDGG